MTIDNPQIPTATLLEFRTVTPPDTESLDAIGRSNNTDKASRWKNANGQLQHGHNYLHVYERYFNKFRFKPVVLVEIGVGPEWNCGASVRTWLNYFVHHQTQIIGVDNAKHANRDFGKRATILLGDASEQAFISKVGNDYRPHIVVDDGSHIWSHQISTFCYLFPFVQPGGIYIVEDVGTSFGTLRANYSAGPTDFFSAAASLITNIVGGGQQHPLADSLPSALNSQSAEIQSITCFREVVLIEKKGSV
jgi:hypothetical protein